MSYITDLETLFNTLYPGGTFIFSSEVRADDAARNIPEDAYPLFVIDDQPLVTSTVINEDSSATDSPRLTVYVLTKLDLLGEVITENNSNRLTQHEQCVEPMKVVAIRVLGQYFRSGNPVQRTRGVKPTMTVTDKYNLWPKMLYGVQVNVTNLNLQRIINYCTS
ncbi:MAG: hypothetical protein GY853_16795 [PVC group bacterium]|nr:hypothetical protein [PVC group bacterium]